MTVLTTNLWMKKQPNQIHSGKQISAADTSEKDNANGANESTLTASKNTDTDDEKSVTIPASTSTDGSTLVEKIDFPLPQFFPDSDISTQNNSNSSGDKNDTKNDATADEQAEVTDNTMKDGKGEKNKKITDNTKNDANGEKEKITEEKKTDPEAVATLVDNGE